MITKWKCEYVPIFKIRAMDPTLLRMVNDSHHYTKFTQLEETQNAPHY